MDDRQRLLSPWGWSQQTDGHGHSAIKQDKQTVNASWAHYRRETEMMMIIILALIITMMIDGWSGSRGPVVLWFGGDRGPATLSQWSPGSLPYLHTREGRKWKETKHKGKGMSAMASPIQPPPHLLLGTMRDA